MKKEGGGVYGTQKAKIVAQGRSTQSWLFEGVPGKRTILRGIGEEVFGGGGLGDGTSESIPGLRATSKNSGVGPLGGP